MKNLLIIFFLLIALPVAAQITGQNFTSSEFGWTIKIPEKFEMLSSNQTDKLHDTGIDAIEKTYDVSNLEIQLEKNTTLFAAKKGVADFIVVMMIM
jgi:hypothetical protein